MPVNPEIDINSLLYTPGGNPIRSDDEGELAPGGKYFSAPAEIPGIFNVFVTDKNGQYVFSHQTYEDPIK